jgi:hypothetical protein
MNLMNIYNCNIIAVGNKIGDFSVYLEKQINQKPFFIA